MGPKSSCYQDRLKAIDNHVRLLGSLSEGRGANLTTVRHQSHHPVRAWEERDMQIQLMGFEQVSQWGREDAVTLCEGIYMPIPCCCCLVYI